MGRVTVAALFVDPRGCYAGLAGVDPWDEARDARLYAGPHPVVAHPPCSRWCRLAGLVEARWGHRRGEDGGCFASALANVRRWGGVLEHPAYTDAWAAYGLPRPDRHGGWQGTLCGGFVCQVEQGRYGHPATKATWLYAHGMAHADLPALRWGYSRAGKGCWRDSAKRVVGWCRNNRVATDTRPTVSKREAKATPPEFRDVLIALAARCRR